MLGVRVTVPVACFRKGLAREYLETESLPPPATCYGFLLSLVGETRRLRHVGCRVCPVVIGKPEVSVVLRTIWRLKKAPLGSAGNTRPDYQQLLTSLDIVIWLDSSQENGKDPSLEMRIAHALQTPSNVDRFGGLCLGESTHLVNDLWRFEGDPLMNGMAFHVAPAGRRTLPVWVDHIGSSGTRYATGDFVNAPLTPPDISKMSHIDPGG